MLNMIYQKSKIIKQFFVFLRPRLGLPVVELVTRPHVICRQIAQEAHFSDFDFIDSSEFIVEKKGLIVLLT